MQKRKSKTKDSLMNFYRKYKTADYKDKSVLSSRITLLWNFGMAIFKIVVGIFIHSIIFAYSGLTAITSGLCKHFYFRAHELREKNLTAYHYYRAIGITQFFSAFFFDMCMMMKQYYLGEIYRASPFFASCISILFIIDYLIVINEMFKTRKICDDYMMALQLVSLSGVLMTFILMQRIVLSASTLSNQAIATINSFVGYSIGFLIFTIAVYLFVKSFIIEKKEKDICN